MVRPKKRITKELPVDSTVPVTDIEIIPIPGHWIVHEKKQVIAGMIREIKKDIVVWEDASGTLIESNKQIFRKENYSYVLLQPTMLKWKLLGNF